MASLLSVKDLSIGYRTKYGMTDTVDRVSFELQKGEVLGIVGESGCGKSTVAHAILRLLASNGVITGGSILLEGQDLVALSEQDMCRIRGDRIAMIFQDPMSALNPTMTIGHQMEEPFLYHQNMSRHEAEKQALDMLRRVGIPNPEKRMKEYPHQLSGGMRQRVMIAMALSCKPDLLIADEPTTALDVTIQAQILDLMRRLREENGTAILFITHDLGVVAEMADQVMVMYAGRMAEYATVDETFDHPMHPYTQGLLRALPSLEGNVERLEQIDGVVPSPSRMPSGCRFAPRCPHAMESCRRQAPDAVTVGSHQVACRLYEKAAL